MPDTTLTWTFPDTTEQDLFWTEYCDHFGIPYADAAEAETNALAAIKDQIANTLAIKRADAAVTATKETTRASEYADLSGY